MQENKIIIDGNTALAEIQSRFNHLFPYLWLEFYDKDTDDSHPSSKRIKYIDGKTVSQCRVGHKIGTITILPDMSILDLENLFFETVGLSIQVLRKSGNIWMETPQTDSWSLEQQNRQGETISGFISKQGEKRKGQ